jgi:hypothetical protein
MESSGQLAPDTRNIFDKTPRYIKEIDRILESFSELKAIVLVRDFRSLVYSTFKRSGVELEDWIEERYPKTVRFMNKNIDAYERLMASGAGQRAMIVRYEDLCFDTEAVCTSIFEFLGLRFDSEYLRFENPKFPNVYGSAIDQKYVFRFREEFDEEFQHRIRQDFSRRSEWFWNEPESFEG